MSHIYLCSMAEGKVAAHHSWGSIVANAVGNLLSILYSYMLGANFFVGLGTVAFKGALSHSGMMAACAGPVRHIAFNYSISHQVVNFCIGSFQHVVANMYTLHAGRLPDRTPN